MATMTVVWDRGKRQVVSGPHPTSGDADAAIKRLQGHDHDPKRVYDKVSVTV